MPPVIGGFAINISAFTAGLQRGLANARKRIKAFSVGIANAVKRVAQLGAAATAAAVGGLTLLFNRQRQIIDNLGKTSDRLGIATETLQTFQLAGELAGVSSDKISKSLEVMQKRLGEAAGGTGQAKKVLEDLGLSIDSLLQMTPDQQFRMIADAIAGMDTQAEKAAATAGIFSRANQDLLNLIQGGSAALDSAAADVEKFGIGLSRVDAAQVEAANDALTRLGAVLKGIGQRITVALAPFVEALVEKFTDLAAQGPNLSTIINGALEKIAIGVGFVADVWTKFQGVFKVVQGVVTTGLELMVRGLALFAKGLEKVLGLVGIEVKLTETLDAVAEGLAELADEQFDAAIDKFTAPSKREQIKDFFAGIQEESRKEAEKVAEAAAQATAIKTPGASKATDPQFTSGALRGTQAAASAINKAFLGSAKNPQVDEQKKTNVFLSHILRSMQTDPTLRSVIGTLNFSETE